MKKLIVAIALIACAVSANASKVTWGSSAALDDITSGKMYLMISTSTFDATKFNNQTSFSESILATAGLDVKLSSFDYSTSVFKTTGDTFMLSDIQKAYEGKSIAAGNKDAYTVLIGTDATGKQYLAYAGPATVALNNNSSPLATKTTQKSAFTVVPATATPEPTSAMLLLLGFAGLALRRRRT